MIVTCDSDAAVFILHCSFTSVFCLRRECRRLKPSVLLILAMSEVMAVLCRTFADLPFGKSSWFDVFCSCKHPHVLLQIGASCLNVVLIAANTEVSENALVTKCQRYAGDTQLYVAFKPDDNVKQNIAVTNMQNAIDAIKKLMVAYKLKLNDAKSEFTIISARQQLAKSMLIICE
ncbi:uncharacterized protein [Montipora foliosa]|uniref:uncharacterized protein isoform X1 n=1 Tax=Montipora foliosa TaxID=591990 RepID=UPI0035F1F1F8